MFAAMASVVSDEPGDPFVILLGAGLLREDHPWLAEMLVVTYRELRTGDTARGTRAILRILGILRSMDRGPLGEMLGPQPKYLREVFQELRMFIELLPRRFEFYERTEDAEEEDAEDEDNGEE